MGRAESRAEIANANDVFLINKLHLISHRPGCDWHLYMGKTESKRTHFHSEIRLKEISQQIIDRPCGGSCESFSVLY